MGILHTKSAIYSKYFWLGVYNLWASDDGRYFPGFMILYGSNSFLTPYIVFSVDGSLIRGKYLCLYYPNPCSADIEPFLFITSSKTPSSINFDSSAFFSNKPGETILQCKLPSIGMINIDMCQERRKENNFRSHHR